MVVWRLSYEIITAQLVSHDHDVMAHVGLSKKRLPSKSGWEDHINHGFSMFSYSMCYCILLGGHPKKWLDPVGGHHGLWAQRQALWLWADAGPAQEPRFLWIQADSPRIGVCWHMLRNWFGDLFIIIQLSLLPSCLGMHFRAKKSQKAPNRLDPKFASES